VNLALRLSDVIVGLQTAGTVGSASQRVIATDAAGNFKFTLPNGANLTALQVAILNDGRLSTKDSRTSASFLVGYRDVECHGLDHLVCTPHYGAPKVASLSSLALDLFIDETTNPVYNRAVDKTGFEGTSLPLRFWQYQQGTAPIGSGYRKKDPVLGSPTVRTAANILASDPSCTSPDVTPMLMSSSALDSNLAAAALNIAVSRGVFDPYMDAQTWLFAFAKHARCDPSASTRDREIATDFVIAINGAADLDRP